VDVDRQLSCRYRGCVAVNWLCQQGLHCIVVYHCIPMSLLTYVYVGAFDLKDHILAKLAVSVFVLFSYCIFLDELFFY